MFVWVIRDHSPLLQVLSRWWEYVRCNMVVGWDKVRVWPAQAACVDRARAVFERDVLKPENKNTISQNTSL